MKRIFVPTSTGTDWQPLLAKPKTHWKLGASAMTTAAAWEAANGELPAEIAKALNSSREPILVNQQLLIAIPEWEVPLPGGERPSNTDVLAICRNDKGLCILGVEAKVLEDFGPTISNKRKEASAGQMERLEYLHHLLDVERFDDAIRYQLLHRTASALLTAREFHAAAAVMVIQAFDTPEAKRADFEAFRLAMGAIEMAPLVYKVASFKEPELFLAWCEGDTNFRNVSLPSSSEFLTEPEQD